MQSASRRWPRTKGVEGTRKEGRGPIYRQRMDELGKLQDDLKIEEERVKDAQKRLADTETRIAQIKRELAAIDGELAKYKGEAETAGAAHQHDAGEPAPAMPTRASIPPACCRPSKRPAPSSASIPTPDRLSKLQAQCGQLYSAMIRPR